MRATISRVADGLRRMLARASEQYDDHSNIDEHAFQAGMKAWEAMELFPKNPHKRGTIHRRSWARGYDEAVRLSRW